MKVLRTISGIMAMSLVAIPNAFAGATRVYSSSMLVLAFVGFLALVVAIQLIPAVMTLFGAIKGVARKNGDVKTVDAEAGK
jgi:hypothetical protein